MENTILIIFPSKGDAWSKGTLFMKNRDLIGSLFWIGVGLFFCGGALMYGLMEEGVPGPGLLPLIAGTALIALGIGILVPALKREERLWGLDGLDGRCQFRWAS